MERVALIHHTHVLEFRSGNQRREWDECWGCYDKAEKRAAQLKAEAIEDRKVKLPESQPRTRRSTGLPFIDQIEGSE